MRAVSGFGLAAATLSCLGGLLRAEPGLVTRQDGQPSTERPAARGDDESPLASFYGFRAPEILKLESRSANLVSDDLNGDGLRDLAIVDNSHSRIDVLQQRKRPIGEETPGNGVNAVPDTGRFEHTKIPVDKQVVSLAAGDFDSDGRADLAYFGVPDRLVVRYGAEGGTWNERFSVRLPDVPARAWNLAAGDLDSDGRTDLVVLGENETYLLLQSDDGLPNAPRRLLNTSDKLSLAHIADLDGDGRDDLLYVAGDSGDRVICARRQGSDGRLGPELRFDLKNPRSVSIAELDGRPGIEIVAIDSPAGRVRVSRWQDVDSGGLQSPRRLVQYGVGRGTLARDRDLAIADLDGDGSNDVVVTDPDAARMIVFRRRPGRGLDLGTPFPGLQETRHVRAADLDGDGKPELVVLSPREKILGVSRFENGRLTFPDALEVVGEPSACEVADLDGDGRPEIIYVATETEARTSRYSLRALRRDGDGWAPAAFGQETEVEFELRGTPERMLRLYANADARPDLLVFPALGRTPLLFVTNADGIPEPVTPSAGIGLGDVAPAAVYVAGGPSPSILVTQEQFARQLRLGDDRRWRVVDQFNAVESGARLAAAAMLDLDGRPGEEIVLVDEGIGKLRLLRGEGEMYASWTEVELGEFSCEGTRVADLDGDDREDLILIGRGRFAVLYAAGPLGRLEEAATYETPLENVHLSDAVAGDLNGDGHVDLALIDTRSHFVELLDYDGTEGLRRGLHIRVIEEKSFSAPEESGTEPRESLIVDVTGDGRADLVLLAHDRVLVYPQDDGRDGEGGVIAAP